MVLQFNFKYCIVMYNPNGTFPYRVPKKEIFLCMEFEYDTQKLGLFT